MIISGTAAVARGSLAARGKAVIQPGTGQTKPDVVTDIWKKREFTLNYIFTGK
jgi:hypothetical protein